MGDPGIIDRRTQGGKSAGNRELFRGRNSKVIRDAVRKKILRDGIDSIGKDGEDIVIPKRDLSEPIFHHGQGGIRETVHPGNKEYVTGDHIERPKGGGSGSGGGQASDSGEGEDDFVFHLTKEEFMQIFFEDLALPNLVRTSLADVREWKSQRAGYQPVGTPNNLSIVKSMGKSIGRRIVFHKAIYIALLALLEELSLLDGASHLNPINFDVERDELLEKISEVEILLKRDPVVEAARPTDERIASVNAKLRSMPYLDDIDLLFRAHTRVPVPTSKAVMFCLMDVSGSMDELRKELSKRFFILLYLFLTRHYEKIDLVFIRHHTQAEEVTEEVFFRDRATGGTVVSTALVLMEEIIRNRYPLNEWNVYGAQASDGDNWNDDSGRCTQILEEKLLPVCRYFAYIQVAAEEQNLWKEYQQIAAGNYKGRFAMRKALAVDQIYPVFRDLFKAKGGKE